MSERRAAAVLVGLGAGVGLAPLLAALPDAWRWVAMAVALGAAAVLWLDAQRRP